MPRIARLRAAIVFTLPILGSAAAQAQPVADHLLSRAEVAERGACSLLNIEFYSRVSLTSHFPQDAGDELKLMLQVFDRAPVTPQKPGTTSVEKQAVATPRRESLRAPTSERASISAIEFDGGATQPTLAVYFKRKATFRVAMGKDGRSVVVAIADKTAKAACEPVWDDGGSASPMPPPSTAKSGNPALDADMAEARAALAMKDFDRAIGFLTKVTEAGTTKLLPEALELLGHAREQKGHLAHARADYHSYLKQFPQGDGAARVTQRLAALDKRETERIAPLAAAAGGNGSTKLEPAAGGAGAGGSALRPSIADNGKSVDDPNAWKVTHAGSVSTYYNRNQGGRDFFVKPQQQQGWERENIYRVYRNSTLATGDAETTAERGGARFRVHGSASQEHRFTDGTDDWRVSSLNVEAKSKDIGTALRVGRQTYYGGGILGRFDGALATYELSELWKLRAYGGAPVERSSDRPFLFDRYFFGTSADYKWSKDLELGMFVVEQRTDQFVDRRGIGGEVRFTNEQAHAFASTDYDLHFGAVNSLFGTGTRIFDDKSSVSLTLDYRRSPTLFATNALQGQIETSLKDLLRRYTADEVESLARDRTPRSAVVSASYSRYLTERLQAIGEVTVTNMSSMRASGGVPETPSTGWDVYTSGQLIANDVLREHDSLSGALRLAATQSANRAQAELSWRVPVWDWRLGPVVRFGIADYKIEPMKEYHVHPLMRASYNITSALSFEAEAGARFTQRINYQGRANESELLLLTGMRYDLNSARR